MKPNFPLIREALEKRGHKGRLCDRLDEAVGDTTDLFETALMEDEDLVQRLLNAKKKTNPPMTQEEFLSWLRK
jgi:hypothetical protein